MIKEDDITHKRYSFSIYSEEGCQYAEDVALSGAGVSVYYTSDCCDCSWNWHKKRVYKFAISEHEGKTEVIEKKKNE